MPFEVLCRLWVILTFKADKCRVASPAPLILRCRGGETMGRDQIWKSVSLIRKNKWMSIHKEVDIILTWPILKGITVSNLHLQDGFFFKDKSLTFISRIHWLKTEERRFRTAQPSKRKLLDSSRWRDTLTVLSFLYFSFKGHILQ